MRCALVLRIAILAAAVGWGGRGVAVAQTPAAAPVPPPVIAGPAQAPPTPLEQAVIEHACRVPGQAMLTAEAYDACLGEQLAGLRVEFGKDLQKLSAGERRTIDRACTALRDERGRDAYVACLDQRLTALVTARGRTRPPVSPVPPPLPFVDPVTAPASDVPSPPVAPAGGGTSMWVWIALVITLVAAAAGYAAWTSRAKRGPVLCRVCGELAHAGDLCAACRHELAESQRRTAAERSEQALSVAGAAQRALEEAAARQREAEPVALAVQHAHERDAEVQTPAPVMQDGDRRRESDHLRWQEAAAATISEDEVATPYSILGVASDATVEQVRTAYDAAMAKYAADQVAHLGVELQDHYRRKREAAEHALEALSANVSANADA